MEVPEVRQLLLSKGLYHDPAFRDTNLFIQPIPRFDGCPLGLYFPEAEYVHEFHQVIPANTIIAPREAEKGTVLHELGHRYGHYYYHDLSEKFAEDFRKKYQQGTALLYQGSDFHRLPSFDKLFQEGERGMVEMDFDRALSPSELSQLRRELEARSDNEAPPAVSQVSRNGRPLVRVAFTKGVAWLVVIPAIVIFAIGAALFYGVYKMFATVPWIVPTALLGLGVFLGLKWLYQGAKSGR